MYSSSRSRSSLSYSISVSAESSLLSVCGGEILEFERINVLSSPLSLCAPGKLSRRTWRRVLLEGSESRLVFATATKTETETETETESGSVQDAQDHTICGDERTAICVEVLGPLSSQRAENP